MQTQLQSMQQVRRSRPDSLCCLLLVMLYIPGGTCKGRAVGIRQSDAALLQDVGIRLSDAALLQDVGIRLSDAALLQDVGPPQMLCVPEIPDLSKVI